MKKKPWGILVFIVVGILFLNTTVYALYNEAKNKSEKKIKFLIEKVDKCSRTEIRQIRDDLLFIGKPVVPYLVEELNCIDINKNFVIRDILIFYNATEAIPTLISLLDCKEKIIVLNSISILGSLKDMRAREPLLEILNNSNDTVIKGSAIFYLGVLGDKSVIPIIKKELVNKESHIRMRTASALGLLDNKEGLPVALEFSKSKNLSEKRNAIITLGMIGDNETIPFLEEMLVNSDNKVKSEIVLSIKQIKYKNLSESKKISFLEECIQSDEIKVKQWACWKLGEIDIPDALKILEKYNNDDEILSIIKKLKLKQKWNIKV